MNCFGQAKTDKNDNENNSSFSVGYIGSSFATEIRMKNLTVVEEEQSITDHNYNHTIEGMDYITKYRRLYSRSKWITKSKH